MKQTNRISIQNFHKKIRPELSVRQKAIYDLIKQRGESTSNDIAEYLKVRLNTISGRFSELKDKGKIKEVARREGFAVYKIIEEPGTQLKFKLNK
jgi:DeoR/GlpR family transcriptional regulator of sugar metabolism